MAMPPTGRREVASLSGHTTCATIPNVTREKLVKAAEEFRRLEDDLAAARDRLAAAIVEAGRVKMPPTEISRLSGYTREHIRRIHRAAGIEPYS